MKRGEIQLEHEDIDAVLEDPVVRGLLEHVSDGALVVDARSRQILAMNAVARDLLGYRESEAIGCQCRRIMRAPSCDVSCPLDRLLGGRTPRVEVELYYRGRDERTVLHAETRMVLLRGPDGEPLAAVELFRDLSEVQALRRELRDRRHLHHMIGESEPMQEVFARIEEVAPYDIPVLITGESGVGKERVADAIHQLSERSSAPFVKVNCAALSPSLVESELFGHVEGAFTGAGRARRGYFDRADGGSLQLDEVAELPPETQAKLLRVLQEGEVQRVGDDEPHRVDVRILAATNRDLAEAVASGQFRQDLYYRLLGAHIEVPPLRERPEDIAPLARHFLARFDEDRDGPSLRFGDGALAALLEQRWRGNVRELARVVQLACIRAASGGVVLPEHIRVADDPLGAARSREAGPDGRPAGSPGEASPGDVFDLSELEERAIDRALEHTDGNMTAAARLLGIDRTTLWRKLKNRDPDHERPGRG
jgi:transcriptional regulator with PAS, ATPase and Fis domain